jgi:hypothetical protein
MRPADKVYEDAEIKSIRFFRANGYRRVGRTCYFCNALGDPEHRSKRLSAENDADGLNDVSNTVGIPDNSSPEAFKFT